MEHEHAAISQGRPGGQPAASLAMTQRPAESRTMWMALGLIARLFVGALFILAALGKLAEPMKFAEEIRKYNLVKMEITNAMAIVIPWLEIVAGGLLVLGVWRREARLLIFLMLVVFTIAKVSAELRGLKIECGCLGQLGQLGWVAKALEGWNGVALNVVLMGLLVLDEFAQRILTPRRASAGSDAPREADGKQTR